MKTDARTTYVSAFGHGLTHSSARNGGHQDAPGAWLAARKDTGGRDRWANDDLLEVVIDSHNDNETAVIFSVNPAGTRIDAQVTRQAVVDSGFRVGKGAYGPLRTGACISGADRRAQAGLRSSPTPRCS